MWRAEGSRQLVERTRKKLDEKGIEEAAQIGLLTAAKFLFSDNEHIWPLKYTFYYLGHIPPLDNLLPHIGVLDLIARERLLHHLAADWHLQAIRLAGRIFGDYQREMAKKNDPIRLRGRAAGNGR